MEQLRMGMLANQLKPLDQEASEVDKKKHGRKVELIPHVEAYVAEHPMFVGKEVDMTVAETGVSSFVCIVKASEEKFVLKIPVTNRMSEGETDCLKAWESVGVAVPHIIEESVIGGRPSVLMSYIDAKRIVELTHEEKAEKNIHSKLGMTLKHMHEAYAEGYGFVENHRAQYESFDAWINSEYVQNAIKDVTEQGVFDEAKHGSINAAIDILKEFVKDKKSVFCHFDFSEGNAFDTDPITVFDPFPQINNPYLDVGRTIVLFVGTTNDSETKVDQFLSGYFGEQEIIDRKALQAGVILNAYLKFSFWLKIGQEKRIQKTLAYLEKTKHHLK